MVLQVGGDLWPRAQKRKKHSLGFWVTEKELESMWGARMEFRIVIDVSHSVSLCESLTQNIKISRDINGFVSWFSSFYSEETETQES